MPQKGLETLTGAFARAASPWRAVFVGGGPLEPLLQRFARAHEPRVRW